MTAEVDAWFEEDEHPQKEAMQLVREIIMSDGRMSETIKWKSQTFMYGGNLASFNPRTKAHVSLMFHTGASIPASTCCWKAEATRPDTPSSTVVEDVESKRSDLLAVVEASCQSRV